MYRSTLLSIGSLIALSTFTALSGSPRQAQPGGAADEGTNARQAESQSKAGQAADPDEQLLEEAGIRTDSASLIAFLNKQSASDADLLNSDRLLRQLGSKSFKEREEASKKLVALGTPAMRPLQVAMRDPDPEVTRSAKACVSDIAPKVNTRLPMAAVRMLVQRRAPGAIEALLAHLPSASADEELVEEIVYGLDGLAIQNGTLSAALSAALKDALPDRRAAAACIIGRVGDTQQRAVVRRLLADNDPTVRLRAAQGLLAGKDKMAIPVLIELLSQPSVEVTWQAEELLHWVGGARAPSETIGSGSAEACQKCQRAWKAWWQAWGAELDLTGLDKDSRRPGLILVCEKIAPIAARRQEGRVWLSRAWLCGCDGKPRWQLEGLRYPRRVQLLPGNQLLIAEAGICLPVMSIGELLNATCMETSIGNDSSPKFHLMLRLYPMETDS